jgi:hypothetical protein
VNISGSTILAVSSASAGSAATVYDKCSAHKKTAIDQSRWLFQILRAAGAPPKCRAIVPL